MEPAVAALWASTRLRVVPERYVLASLAPSRLGEAAALVAAGAGEFAALLRERDEISLTVTEAAWHGSALAAMATAAAGPYRVITFDLALDLGIVGYFAPPAAALAAARVPIVPQCAYAKDHLLVREEDLERALAALRALGAG
jgi:hypothetical protein